MNHVSVNGEWLPAGTPALTVSNRSYRYGEGLFETLKVANGKIPLGSLHFERLFAGMSLLKISPASGFTQKKFEDEILRLCQRNQCGRLARVRLSVSGGNGGLYEEAGPPGYVIECSPLPDSVERLNEEGMEIDIYPDARKSCDLFSGIKSANFLPYVMAARFAMEKKLDDCLVLNEHNRIADSTLANVFVYKNGSWVTPPLSEAGVNGVMRKFLLHQFEAGGIPLREEGLADSDLAGADEIFLSNAIYGLRWVKRFRERTFGKKRTAEIYRQIDQTFFSRGC